MTVDFRCPACHATGFSVLAEWREWAKSCTERPDGAMRLSAARDCGVAADEPRLLECNHCRSISMSPLPEPEQLATFYKNYHATDSFVAKAPKKVFRAMKRLLLIRMLMGRGRFLEVGASIGAAAEAARRLGFEAIAQDIDAVAVSRGRGLFPDVKFFEGAVETLANDPPFSVIYCAEVIEHTRNPRSFASALFNLLAPGGCLFLTSPDAGHPRRPRQILRWQSVKPPEHIVLFTKSGLRAVMDAAGFKPPMFFPYLKPGIRMIARRPD